MNMNLKRPPKNPENLFWRIHQRGEGRFGVRVKSRSPLRQRGLSSILQCFVLAEEVTKFLTQSTKNWKLEFKGDSF